MNLPLALKRLRLERGLTQAALAELCGIAQPNLAAMERGRRQATLATLRRLADALGQPMDALLRPHGSGLGRFALDDACQRLVRAQAKPVALDAGLWRDLQVTFRPKLMAHRPGLIRPRLRISARAAEQRLKARLGRAGLDEVARRLEKAYA
jgi:transcriptional regulator with XRE-family HTH domain